MSGASQPSDHRTRARAQNEHPSLAVALQGRRLVRPRLHPHASVALAHPRRGLVHEAVRAAAARAYNGAPTDVMLQGFHWTSSGSAAPAWYEILAENASRIREAPFDLV